MDKETLSNYGWVVITVLVLAIMIALATPFGTYISDGVKSTTAGLFKAEQNALNVALDGAGVSVEDQEFSDVPTVNGNTDSTPTIIMDVLVGDVNFDGVIDMLDSVYVTRIVKNTLYNYETSFEKYSNENPTSNITTIDDFTNLVHTAADCNGDGVLNGDDETCMMNFLADNESDLGLINQITTYKTNIVRV